MTAPEPAIGLVYKLGEADYRYGIGPLLVQVLAVKGEVVYGDEAWYEVSVRAKVPDTVGDGLERDLYVRAASLRPFRAAL